MHELQLIMTFWTVINDILGTSEVICQFFWGVTKLLANHITSDRKNRYSR